MVSRWAPKRYGIASVQLEAVDAVLYAGKTAIPSNGRWLPLPSDPGTHLGPAWDLPGTHRGAPGTWVGRGSHRSQLSARHISGPLCKYMSRAQPFIASAISHPQACLPDLLTRLPPQRAVGHLLLSRARSIPPRPVPS